MTRMSRSLPMLVLAAAAFMVTVAQGAAQDASGSVEIASTTMAAGIGVSWGDGTLTLTDGSRYRFTVDKLKVGAVGISSMQAMGRV